MCAHLLSPSVVGVNPITEPRWPVKRNAIGWLAEVTFAVQRRRLSCLQILTCSGEKSLFFQPRYETVTFAGVLWRERERERVFSDMDQEGEDVSDILMYVWR